MANTAKELRKSLMFVDITVKYIDELNEALINDQSYLIPLIQLKHKMEDSQIS